MDDRELVELYWQRNERAISETETRYGAYCRAIARGVLGNDADAEECCNDVWVAAWNAIPPQRPDDLRAFLGKIARNLALKRLRSLKAKKRGDGETALALEELEEVVPGGTTLNEQIAARELARKLDEFLGTLGVTERRVFLCRYWYFDDLRDIASRFGMGESRVKMMCKRTRDKLRLFLRKEDLLS
jgi:RNA polymerase sigma-70 factor (ECF subfamily)